MKRYLSEKQGLERLTQIRAELAQDIVENYEHRALPCSKCPTPGVCCIDAHFVNVRVSRLEARAIEQHMRTLPEDTQQSVLNRSKDAINRFGLEPGVDKTYACPLYQIGIGCLVHDVAKPLPCVAHACYENSEDLPPDSLLAEGELKIDDLNERVYSRSADWLPIPIAIIKSF